MKNMKKKVLDQIPDLPAVWNALNVSRRSVVNEPGGGKSETVPNQAMSVRDILRRFAQGLPIDGARVPLYDDPSGDNDEAEGMPDLSRMDIEEIDELRLRTEERIFLLTKKLQDEEKAKVGDTPAIV